MHCNEKASCCNKKRSPVLQLEKVLQTTTRESLDAATKTDNQNSQNKKKGKHSKCVDDGVTVIGIHCPTSELGREH